RRQVIELEAAFFVAQCVNKQLVVRPLDLRPANGRIGRRIEDAAGNRAVTVSLAAGVGPSLLSIGDTSGSRQEADRDHRSNNPVAHEPMFVSPAFSIARLARAFNGSCPSEAHAVPPDGR